MNIAPLLVGEVTDVLPYILQSKGGLGPVILGILNLNLGKINFIFFTHQVSIH